MHLISVSLLNFRSMERYVWKRNKDTGIYVLNLAKTYEKLQARDLNFELFIMPCT